MSGAAIASPSTDFGIRIVGAPSSQPAATSTVRTAAPRISGSNLKPAAAIGARWGRVTSTYRSVARNRAVGGVRNSWHLSGRAIDIARRRGVSHAEIASAFRAAGYSLIESLDEGDHSHFAFGSGLATGASRSNSLAAVSTAQAEQVASEMTDWGIVTLSSRRGRGKAGR